MDLTGTGREGVDWTHLAELGHCEQNNECIGFVRGEEFVD